MKDPEALKAASYVKDAEDALGRAHESCQWRAWTDALERIKAELEQLRADMEDGA